jgi:TATA-box binding protein (TBP) (component of TFIID and TFIIIB)
MIITLPQKHSIVNVVVTTDLKQPVDLEKLTEPKEVAYDPRKYNGKVAYFKSEKMQGKVTIFFSTGSQSA